VEIHAQVLCIMKHTIFEKTIFLATLKSKPILFFTVACKRVCPGGRPNKDCSYCICDGQTLQGEVFSITGVPVANATVALASQANVIRAYSDAKGQFKIKGLCTNPQSRVLIQKDKFSPITLPVSINSTNELWVRGVLRSSGKKKTKKT